MKRMLAMLLCFSLVCTWSAQTAYAQTVSDVPIGTSDVPEEADEVQITTPTDMQPLGIMRTGEQQITRIEIVHDTLYPNEAPGSWLQGDTRRLYIQAYAGDRFLEDINPDVTWSLSNASEGTTIEESETEAGTAVVNVGNDQLLFQGRFESALTITATLKSNTEISVDAAVAINSYFLSVLGNEGETQIKLSRGETYQFECTVYPSLPENFEFEWNLVDTPKVGESLKPPVHSTISPDGLVTVGALETSVWFDVLPISHSKAEAIGATLLSPTVMIRNPLPPEKTIADTTTGVSAVGQIDEGTVLSVTVNSSHTQGTDDACDEIHVEQDNGNLIALYDIAVTGGSFTGALTITVPVPAQHNNSIVSILHCKNGILEKLSAVVADGKVTFKLDSLSPVAIVLPTGSGEAISFVDINFKNALLAIDGIDTNGDGEISFNEASAVTSLDVSSKNILDLSGIEHFTALSVLKCNNNKLASFDATGLAELDTLFCGENQLQSIDVSGLTKLRLFSCYNNRLATINLTGLTKLEGFQCNDNLLTTLNLTDLTSLAKLYCKNNYMPDTTALIGYNSTLTTLLEFNPQNIGLPSGPTNLRAVSSIGKITLSWDAPDNDGGSAITGYKVYTATFPNEEWRTVTSGDMHYDFTGLQGDKAYSFFVKAINNTGEGLPSWIIAKHNAININDATVTVIGTHTYTGSPIEPKSGGIKVEHGGFALTEGTDYTLSYENNTNAGTATLIATGAGSYTGTKNQTFVIQKAAQTAPPAPTLASKTATDITLSASADTEYREGASGAWQDSHAFSGLSPSTTYSFSARLKGTANYNASPVSPAFTVTTEKATLSGGVSIIGVPKFSQTLTADTSSLSSAPSAVLGAINYQWRRGGTNIPGAINAGYQLVQADIGQTISVTVSAANCSGEKISNATAVVDKADAPAAPNVTGSYNGDGSTFTYKVNERAGAEYSKDGSTWQDSNVFNGFTTASPATTFSARLKETATHKAGAAGNTGAVAFAKLSDQSVPPLAYTISGDRTAITITAISGAEYKFGNDAWGASNSKNGYSGTETVIIQIRRAETPTHNASAVNSFAINLSKQDQTAPNTFILEYAYNIGANNFAVSIPAIINGEYSFDGINYADTRTTSANPGDFVTGYARYKETGTHNASPAATASLTLPYPVISIAVTGAGGASAITNKGGTLQMSAVVLPAQSTQSVSWSAAGNAASIDANGLLTAASNGSITVRATAKDNTGEYGEMTVTISGQDENSGGNSGNGSGGSSSSDSNSSTPSITPSLPTDNQPTTPTVAKSVISSTINGNVLTVNISAQMVKDAIKAAQNAAKSSGKVSNGIAVQFIVSNTGRYDSVSYKFDRAGLQALKDAGVKHVTIGSAVIDLTLDAKTLETVLAQTTGAVTVSATKQDNSKLSIHAKNAIGDRPVFDINIKGSAGNLVSDLKGGFVTIGIAHKTTNTGTGNLWGVYVKPSGQIEWQTNSSYANGRLIFKRGSLSVYGIGYKAPTTTYADMKDHWAYEDIAFVVSRSMLSGTSTTAFSPDTAITRASFLMALGKLSGTDVSSYTKSSFADVKDTDPAMPYIEWAFKKGIVKGISDGKFGPEQSISRQDMAVMMANYAKATGYKLPTSRTAVTFADDTSISAYAKDAVKAIQQTGIMQGKDGGKFDPHGKTTRAEASAILRRLVELAIDEGTARGWSKNESGHWMYIGESGKEVIGWLPVGESKYYFDAKGIMVSGKWLEISGKWYYFYADGKLAANTTVDGYAVGADGARK